MKSINAMKVLGAMALLWSGSAAAAVFDARALSPADRNATVSAVQKAKEQAPRAFQAVRGVWDRLPELDARKRGRMAAITPMLNAIGPDRLWPLLEWAALEGPARGELTDSAWRAFRVGMLESLGQLRDGRAEPVLTAVLQGTEQDLEVVRAAATALGELQTDSAARSLAELAKDGGPRQAAVVEGMGACRRLAAVESLASVLGQRPSAPVARAAVKALGTAGNAWAWKTPGALAKAEELSVRALAAQTLVQAFAAYDDNWVRQAASNALMVVDSPSTLEHIAAAQAAANSEQRQALAALAERFRSNPTR